MKYELMQRGDRVMFINRGKWCVGTLTDAYPLVDFSNIRYSVEVTNTSKYHGTIKTVRNIHPDFITSGDTARIEFTVERLVAL